MTVFGWDASHYDGLLTTAILVRARAEGVAFFTHKIGEGTGYDDPNDTTALTAARDAGIEFLGGYHVVRSGDTKAQVDYLISLADRDEPWWREHPNWFWQTDLERWSYDNVSAATGVDVSKRLRDATGRQVILYASHGQYGDSLTGWDGPLWNADYTSSPPDGIAAMYPGDGWQPLHGTWRGGWAPYSGKEPTVLQYTSSATIAGLTTCDGNAFRGTLDQFRALITGGTTMTALRDDPDFKYVYTRIDAALNLLDQYPPGSPEAGRAAPLVGLFKELRDNLRWVYPRLEAIIHMLDKVAYGPEKGKDVELVAAIRAIETALSTLAQPVPVAMTAADQEAVADLVAAKLADRLAPLIDLAARIGRP